MAEEMVQSGHPDAQEVETRAESLLSLRSRVHSAWSRRQVRLDQLSDLHCFLRDAAVLRDLSGGQLSLLGAEISPTLTVEEIQNLLKKHDAFEKLLNSQEEKLSLLQSHGDKLLQQKHAQSDVIARELKEVTDARKQVQSARSARRARLLRASLLARAARDVADARSLTHDKRQALARAPHGDVTSLEDKMKRLLQHVTFTAEVTAHTPRVEEAAALVSQVQELDQKSPPHPKDPPLENVVKELALLKEEWGELLKATEERGRGLEEAQDLLEFNQQLDEIEAWIRDKQLMVRGAETGRDYEHCSALIRRLDDLDSGLQVDERRLADVCRLADKLLVQGEPPTVTRVQARRAAALQSWGTLAGSLQQYRGQLASALQVHAYYRDAAEVQERISSALVSLAAPEHARALQAARGALRGHLARWGTYSQEGARVEQLGARARELAEGNPEHKEEITQKMSELQQSWDKLQQVAHNTGLQLQHAVEQHTVDEAIQELEVWVSELQKSLTSSDHPGSIAEADDRLREHLQRKAEIDGRQKSIATLREEAKKAFSDEELETRLKNLDILSDGLQQAWEDRKKELEDSLEYEGVRERARDTEDWLAEKEEELNNDDLGDSIEAVEALQRVHEELSESLESSWSRVEELAAMALKHKELQPILDRALALKERCSLRRQQLQHSLLLHEWAADCRHESQEICVKMQLATDENYRDLSNLQSKIQQHEALEEELTTTKDRIQQLITRGEKLVESNHYASEQLTEYIEDIEKQWRDLESASSSRRSRLQQAYQARVFLRAADEIGGWLDDAELRLLDEEQGTDVPSASSLLARHVRLTAAASAQADGVTSLTPAAAALARDHFMGDELMERATQLQERYRQLQEPLQIRQRQLEDAVNYFRWKRDADEEIRWLTQRTTTLETLGAGSLSVAQATAQLARLRAVEAELAAREPGIQTLTSRWEVLQNGSPPSSMSVTEEGGVQALTSAVQNVRRVLTERRAKITLQRDAAQLLGSISETLSSVRAARRPLTSLPAATDEAALAAARATLAAAQAELAAAGDATGRARDTQRRLLDGVTERTPEIEEVEKQLSQLKEELEQCQLLAAQQDQRLGHAFNYYKFVTEANEASEWMATQTSVAASEEYGLDVEHVDTLQQTFDMFLQQLNANEGRIESVCESGAAIIEAGAPEADQAKRKVEDIRGLWEDLKELALARQEALAGARQVHEFDRAAEETTSRALQKMAAVRAACVTDERLTARGLRGGETALGALRAALGGLADRAERLCAQFPDARDHIRCRLSAAEEAVSSLSAAIDDVTAAVTHRHQLREYFAQYHHLMAWTTATLGRVTAAELGREPAAAQRLLHRHHQLKEEMGSKKDHFERHLADGEKLLSENHPMSDEVSDCMTRLKARRTLLEETWERRLELYKLHLDALLFRRDADALLAWIDDKQRLVRDPALGESVSQVETLLSRHKHLEQTIDAQKDRFEALKRITLVEEAFLRQQKLEKEARKLEADLQIQRQRDAMGLKRNDSIKEDEETSTTSTPATPTVTSPMTSPLTSPLASLPAPVTPNVMAVPPVVSGVKRAESMQVTSPTVYGARRTPSFTTRRRTQSFRRHRTDNELPPIEIEGHLDRKQVLSRGGARAALRSWRGLHSVLCGQLLCFFRSAQHVALSRAAASPLPIAQATCSVASEYRKRPNVFRLSTADGAEFLFAAPTRELMMEWLAKIDFHARLPPPLQLTPYGAVTSSNKDSSSSSSEPPSPAAAPRRSQAEILREKRVSEIESTVLPSLPPRKLENEEVADIVMRSSETPTWGRSRFSNGRDINMDFITSQREAHSPPPPGSSEEYRPISKRDESRPTSRHDDNRPTSRHEESGRPTSRYDESVRPTSRYDESVRPMSRYDENVRPMSRYEESGRPTSRYDDNSPGDVKNNNQQSESANFYSASEIAYGGRPASVAGSGGSPALDQRPASRSSGESELSLSGNPREKKDKKGVFGGLFSRKKRPNSQLN